MSTRYIKRDNVRILGLAKNASQTLKQISIYNDSWELHNENPSVNGKGAIEEFVNHYDKNVVVYFPIRDEIDRAKSEMLEYISKQLRIIYNNDIKSITEDGVEEFMKDFYYHPRFEYFKNPTMKIFLEEILHNDDWSGCKVRFFDLKKLSSHLPKYLGYDDTEIPYYNQSSKDSIKHIIFRYLTDEKWKKRRWDILTKEWQSYYRYISQPFWNGIKKSKYWIEL